MTKISSCRPHFIRCIKPNMSKERDQFLADYVLAQLRYTGVHATVVLRQKGYAMRITFDDFISRCAEHVLVAVSSYEKKYKLFFKMMSV